jgi:hypothetical protein
VAPVGIPEVGAKRGYLDLRLVLHHQNDAEFCADRDALRKKLLDALWARVGANVLVRWLASNFQVAHASTDEVRLMSLSA